MRANKLTFTRLNKEQFKEDLGRLNIAEMAINYGVHPATITNWKSRLRISPRKREQIPVRSVKDDSFYYKGYYVDPLQSHGRKLFGIRGSSLVHESIPTLCKFIDTYHRKMKAPVCEGINFINR